MMNDERGSKDNSSSIHHSSFRVHRLALIPSFAPSDCALTLAQAAV
ncbi:MAG: hypothetical protein QOJ02_1144 [Acidobacteriota bacterium]|jgi:hypothetical protein|nr:hypothetical protein [Acidobacteriota bacterium]